MKVLHPFKFGVNSKSQWGLERYLPPEFETRPIRYLEIGVWEGASCHWMLSTLNVVRGVAVDPYLPLPARPGMKWPIDDPEYMEEIYSHARESLGPWIAVGILDLRREDSSKFWKENTEAFDLIYVDGDHSADAVAGDSEGAWSCLATDGVIIWDDYTGDTQVPQAVNAFLESHVGEWNIFYGTQKQIAVKKCK